MTTPFFWFICFYLNICSITSDLESYVLTNRKSLRKQKFQRTNTSITSVPDPWNIPMPKKSYFAGFSAPTDKQKWINSLMQASNGEQVLLSKVLGTIRSPFDLWQGDQFFRWVHQVSENYISKAEDLPRQKESSSRASIVMLGYTKFDRGSSSGDPHGGSDFSMRDIFQIKDFKFPSKVVAIGRMNENFGYLSTYFLNRSFPSYGFSFNGIDSPFDPSYIPPMKQIQRILDDDNLVMLIVNQHHNISHPKVISIPLGILDPRNMWAVMQKAIRNRNIYKKTVLLYSGGSNWGFRPSIRQCVGKSFHSSDFIVENNRLEATEFRLRLVGSMAVLAMPGQGYDTYRLWEAVAAGAMPVVERGMGMDRTFYKLPVLLLDDYAELTEAILRQAYVEALYRVDNWQYARMTKRWYERLMYDVAETGSIESLLRLHPMGAEDRTFTRPLVPFQCEGGCGVGTKRTPVTSCAIEPSKVRPGYNWHWSHKAPS